MSAAWVFELCDPGGVTSARAVSEGRLVAEVDWPTALEDETVRDSFLGVIFAPSGAQVADFCRPDGGPFVDAVGVLAAARPVIDDLIQRGEL